MPASEPATRPREDQSERRLFRSGDKVSNRYRILRFIARGGMGEVYAALDAELGQPVALKAVRPEVALHSQTLRRFRREINLSRKVTHQNVCRIYDVGTHYSDEQDLSIRYLTMELLEGLTLTRYLRKHGRFSTEEALPIMVQIASGLGAAHDAGVVHRDFKTSNVLLTETSRGLRAVITDFGLSQTLNEDGLTPVDSDKLTGTGQLMGTLAYLAPEQLEGKPSSAATDIYSLGVVLYQMLTGQLPFDGGSPLMAALKRLHEDPPDPRKFVPDLDETWCEVVLRCLERDATKRYQNAEEFLHALGVEALTDSSTSIMRPIIDRRRSGLGTDAYEAPPTADATPGTGTGTAELPLPGRALPMWKAVALAVVAALVALGLTQVAPLLTSPPDIQVLVATPVVYGEEAEFIASSFEAAVLRGLASLQGVHPLDSSKTEGVEGSPSELLGIAAADELVHLEIRDIGREWSVTIKRFGTDGEVLAVEPFRVVQDDSRLQADAIQAGVRRAYPNRGVIEGAGDLNISSDDYSEFLKLRYAIERDSGDLSEEELLQRLTNLRKRAPEFTETSLYEARSAAYLFRMSLNDKYLGQAHESLKRAREQSPNDPRPLEQIINIAVVTEDLELAAEALEQLRAVAPGEVALLRAEATVAKARGDFERAVALMSSACEIQRTPRCLTDLAGNMQDAGRSEKAMEILRQVVSEWPNYWWGKKILAGYEFLHGDLERSRPLYEEVLNPEDPDLLVATNLSIIYLIEDDFDSALKLVRSVGSKYPENVTLLLSLAEAEELAGNKARANELYRRVVSRIGEPKPSDGLGWSARAQALAHLGRGSEAEQSVELMLSARKDDGIAHLEAAIVFSVLGELSAARREANLARQLGVPEHLFRLPWLRSVGTT